MFGLSWSVLIYLRLSLYIVGYLWLSQAISDFIISSQSISFYLGLSLAISGHLWLSRAISGYLSQVSSIRVQIASRSRREQNISI